MDLVAEFSNYVRDIFQNAPETERDQKLATVLARFEDSSVRKAASTMLEIDVDCSSWTDAELANRLVQHVAFRGWKESMLPAHCMMLEAGRRLQSRVRQQP